MVASASTVDQVARILIEEVGEARALQIARRLQDETTGNASYEQTVNALVEKLS